MYCTRVPNYIFSLLAHIVACSMHAVGKCHFVIRLRLKLDPVVHASVTVCSVKFEAKRQRTQFGMQLMSCHQSTLSLSLCSPVDVTRLPFCWGLWARITRKACWPSKLWNWHFWHTAFDVLGHTKWCRRMGIRANPKSLEEVPWAPLPHPNPESVRYS